MCALSANGLSCIHPWAEAEYVAPWDLLAHQHDHLVYVQGALSYLDRLPPPFGR